jgi:hypothetical protein
MAYLLVASGATGSIQVDTNDHNFEMALFADEITLPVGSNPLEGHGSDFDAGSSSGPSIAILPGSGKRLVISALNVSTTGPFWSPPTTEGTLVGGVLNLVEGYTDAGQSSLTIAGPQRASEWAATAAAFRVT